MDPKNIDTEHLRVTGNVADDHYSLRKDDVIIIVTQAYGPRGDSLVGISEVTFDGYPAITVGVRVGDLDTLVHLSPFHGDRRKVCDTEIPLGAKCQLYCPVSKQALDRVDYDDERGTNADYYALYLTPRLSEGEMVVISDIWGDYHSRVVDNWELISSWSASEDDFEEVED